MKKSSDEGKVNALVTGGNGTLGKEIVRCLLEDGEYNVYSLDLCLPEETDRNKDICQYIQADVTNNDDLLVAFKGVDVVFHVAGVIPQVSATYKIMHRVNLVGTETVIKVCKECRVKRLIYTSAIGVIVSKDPKQVLNQADENIPFPENPISAYACTKGAAERAVREANGTGELLTCALRPGGLVSTAYMKMALSYPAIVGDGSYRYPLVPLRATAEAHLLAEKKLLKEGQASVAAGSAYILCFEEEIIQREITEFVASEVGKKVEHLPLTVVKILAYVNSIVYRLTGIVVFSPVLSIEIIKFGVQHHTFSSARAHRELGWPALPPWREVVSKAIKDCTEEPKKNK